MKTRHNKGFTLVELNLSMIFVAMLILGVAFITIQTTKMYQRGVTIKTVNQVGRDVFEQLRRDFANAVPGVVNLSEVSNGRICLGSASYVYNTAAVLNNSSADGITYNGDKVTLMRISDANGMYCQRVGGGTTGAFEHPNVSPSADVTEFLARDVVALAIHNFTATTRQTSNTRGITQALYQISMTIGTNEVDTIDGVAMNCKPPTDNQSNFDNCFVSEFTTIVRGNGDTQ